MFSKIHLELEKKNKYLIQSFLVAVFIYIFTQGVLDVDPLILALLSVVLVTTGVLISHYPGVTRENFLYSILMPLGVLGGAILSLHFYPNLGNVFKIMVIFFFAGVYYLVSLADNIFLVVQDREETIPLYRVAVTWSQILQVIVAIPLFSGIFKINVSPYVQSIIVAVISFLFTYYQLWIYRFEPDAKKIGVGERFYLCFLSLFFIFTSSLVVSFFPSEDFLRALFVSSVLLFLLNYVSAHLKNEISKGMITGYIAIVLVFLSFLLFFAP
ncbi:MAG TPA: hypothetical protein PKH50_00045 [bacterium]|jgi:hypothetical protein|nr:hypothetical protein [bacterium]